MSDAEMADLVQEVAGTALGFDELKSGQEEASAAVVAGRDVLVVMPTGAGKSAIYQIAGPLIGGATVVVSPLIALQRDQVEAIGDDLGGAAQLNSAMSRGDRAAVLDRLRQGALEFVLVAPEQLANDETRDHLERMSPSLFVVDEAHCISAWGHDFRPDYLRLGAFIEALGRPQVLALTATAAPPVRAEIIEQLGMRDPAVVVRGFYRPNIHLSVTTVRDHDAVRTGLLDHVAGTDGTGIVYAATRRQTGELAEALADRGVPAAPYHGGLSKGDRDRVHQRFLEASRLVVAATTAFGMGIDAPHVRFVCHADPPESLDAYYQELGRAGRDGEPAAAVLFRALEGGGGRRYFAGTADIPLATLAAVAVAVERAAGPVPVSDLTVLADATETRLTVILDRLASVGAVRVDADGCICWVAEGMSPEDVARRASDRHERYRVAERTRAEMMQRYLDTDACRWRTILGYFGQPTEENCGNCDNCDAGTADRVSREADRPFPVDARVVHGEWGTGQVVGYDGDTMTVLFPEAGYRTLSVALVREADLLRAAGEV